MGFYNDYENLSFGNEINNFRDTHKCCPITGADWNVNSNLVPRREVFEYKAAPFNDLVIALTASIIAELSQSPFLSKYFARRKDFILKHICCDDAKVCLIDTSNKKKGYSIVAYLYKSDDLETPFNSVVLLDIR
jgi:hypothetical protein